MWARGEPLRVVFGAVVVALAQPVSTTARTPATDPSERTAAITFAWGLTGAGAP